MNKMREQFEVWAHEKEFCLDCKFFEDGNNYEDPDTRLAFEIWQASRAALVVTLPEPLQQRAGATMGESMTSIATLNACRDAIKAAGIRTK